jgi:hypothetical protein
LPFLLVNNFNSQPTAPHFHPNCEPSQIKDQTIDPGTNLCDIVDDRLHKSMLNYAKDYNVNTGSLRSPGYLGTKKQVKTPLHVSKFPHNHA